MSRGFQAHLHTAEVHHCTPAVVVWPRMFRTHLCFLNSRQSVLMMLPPKHIQSARFHISNNNVGLSDALSLNLARVCARVRARARVRVCVCEHQCESKQAQKPRSLTTPRHACR